MIHSSKWAVALPASVQHTTGDQTDARKLAKNGRIASEPRNMPSSVKNLDSSV
jgi:hypothetical protein